MTRTRKDENNRFVMMREEDRSFWAASAYYAEKYKLLVWLAVIFLLALGFDFKLPGQQMKRMQQEIDTLQIQISKVDLLLRVRCLDKQPGDDVKLLAAGINCISILTPSR